MKLKNQKNFVQWHAGLMAGNVTNTAASDKSQTYGFEAGTSFMWRFGELGRMNLGYSFIFERSQDGLIKDYSSHKISAWFTL